jgi:hypothetical protein
MTVFLCYGDEDECPCCGGWVLAEGDGPNNITGVYSLRFCSEDCASEYEEKFACTMRRPYFCDTCGTDNPREHWNHEESQ